MDLTKKHGHIDIAQDIKAHEPSGAALRAVFLPDGDGELFVAYCADAIAACDRAVLCAAVKARLRLQEHAHGLLDARDVLDDVSKSLSESWKCVEQAVSTVNATTSSLQQHVAAREKLDASLDVIARTRAIIRMHSRAEAMVSEDRLHTALRVLGRVDAAVASAPLGSVLTELIPSSGDLRLKIAAKISLSTQKWIAIAGDEGQVIGAHEIAVLRCQEEELSARAGDHGPAIGESRRNKARWVLWIPSMRSDDDGSESQIRGGDWSSSTNYDSYESSNLSTTVVRNRHFGFESPRDAITTGRNEETRYGDSDDLSSLIRNGPEVSLRLLLRGFLVAQDTNTLDEFCKAYQVERTSQLLAFMDHMYEPFGEKGQDSKLQSGTLRIADVRERFASLCSSLAGFLVIEEAVRVHLGVKMIELSTLQQLVSVGLERIDAVILVVCSVLRVDRNRSSRAKKLERSHDSVKEKNRAVVATMQMQRRLLGVLCRYILPKKE